MKKLNIGIKAKNSNYPIVVSSGVLGTISDYLSRSYSQIAVLKDTNIPEQYLQQIRKGFDQDIGLIEVEPGEINKNLKTLEQIWQKMLELKLDRSSLLINLGGGVIGDMGGFAASSYMRGIDFVQVPTTLLSQVDASVGGKVAVNLGGIKNSIGAFSHPQAVIIDTDTLKTLEVEDLRSGFAEVIKHGLIQDREFFGELAEISIENADTDTLKAIIHKTCSLKAEVVEADEKESGIRKILNFGHTVGHALESLSLGTENELRHGEAVTLGMVAEAKISQLIGNISEEEIVEIEDVISKNQLPIRHPEVDHQLILAKMQQDKKNSNSQIKWTLLAELGKAAFDQQVDLDIIDSALNYILD